MAIHLITVVGASTAILPHMLAHYHSLGIHSQLVHVHATDTDDPIIEQARSVASQYDANIASISIAPWSEHINPLLYRMSRSNAPDDWFVLADSDELHIYPDSIGSMVDFCERRGYNAIEGCFVDRLSADGQLKDVSPDEPLQDQFPLGSCLSGPLLGAVINKTVAVKGDARVGKGQHYPTSGTSCPPSELYTPVHHFKWIAGLLPRLRQRVATYKILHESVAAESERFLAYYEREGRINIDDPRFLAAPCVPDYPHWETLKQWRIAAPYFKPC